MILIDTDWAETAELLKYTLVSNSGDIMNYYLLQHGFVQLGPQGALSVET
jgi:hypothetical protein